MSLTSRREYIESARERYRIAKTRLAKAEIIDEVVRILEYHRKYAIQTLNNREGKNVAALKRHKPLKYAESLPIIQVVWEALDYPCAERLHPVMGHIANLLEAHGEISISQQISEQLTQISRATRHDPLSWHTKGTHGFAPIIY